MDLNFLVFLDAGHGGLDAQNRYVTAPSKQFRHGTTGFHSNGWFYEGVWNRTLTNRVAAKLDRLRIPYLMVHHEYLDTPLAYRVDMANWYHDKIKKTVYISNHSNAANGQARGFEVYTSPGQTRSDDIATLHWNNVKDLLGDRIRYREDRADSDPDREANFYVLTKSKMPAILIEHLFFDNLEDARLLFDDDILDRFAEAQVRTIIQAMDML